MFAGSALEFIRWVDRMGAEHGLPLLDIRSNPEIRIDDDRQPPSLEPYDQLLSRTATPEPSQ
ncbi:hypothetical protein FMUBM48_31510 [Nocardia cyriacigeorgica]|nr:hypothetical protein FMUBM48_31510 [Nocardia cyriacigeorgica]